MEEARTRHLVRFTYEFWCHFVYGFGFVTVDEVRLRRRSVYVFAVSGCRALRARSIRGFPVIRDRSTYEGFSLGGRQTQIRSEGESHSAGADRHHDLCWHSVRVSKQNKAGRSLLVRCLYSVLF